MPSHSGSCLELPWVFATMPTTNPYVGKVSHKLRYDGVVVTSYHRLEASLRICVEPRPLVLCEDPATQWVFELDRETRVLLVTVQDQKIRLSTCVA